MRFIHFLLCSLLLEVCKFTRCFIWSEDFRILFHFILRSFRSQSHVVSKVHPFIICRNLKRGHGPRISWRAPAICIQITWAGKFHIRGYCFFHSLHILFYPGNFPSKIFIKMIKIVGNVMSLKVIWEKVIKAPVMVTWSLQG